MSESMLKELRDDEIYPPNFSAGGINAYCLNDCEVIGHQTGYCICVNKIMAYERNGTLNGLSCENEIGNGTCKAIKMRNEELAAGRAIYFVHREKFRAFMDQKAGQVALRPEKPSRRFDNPKPAVPVIEAAISQPLRESKKSADEDGYAAAINRAMQEQKPEPKPEPKPAPAPETKPTPKAGMTLLELARARMGKAA